MTNWNMRDAEAPTTPTCYICEKAIVDDNHLWVYAHNTASMVQVHATCLADKLSTHLRGEMNVIGEFVVMPRDLEGGDAQDTTAG